MVAVQEGVGVAAVGGIPGVQEDAAGQRKIAVDVGVDVGQVVFALENREIDVGVVHGDPGADVLVDGQQFREGGSGFFFVFGGFQFGLEADHVGLDVVGGGVDLLVVPEGVDGIGSGHHQGEAHDEGEQAVCCFQQECRKVHRV